MYCTRQIAENIYWVGGSDRRLQLFENMFPLPDGVSYDAYVILDEKTALMDTVDAAMGQQFLENVERLLQGRGLDYLVVDHMEPDHCALIGEIVRRWPAVQLVGNAGTFRMIKQFYDFPLEGHTLQVKEGDTLSLGSHTLHFVMAPMVHWPEVMMSYEEKEKILFSADAFGTFGAFHGNLFADEVDFPNRYVDEARRYYCNIVGKYGPQVQAVLQKAAGLDIALLCPLHGPVWRKDLTWFLDKYAHWSSYTPEEPGVVLAYASMYGHTANAVDLLADLLADAGVPGIRVYDISKTHSSYIIAEAFRFSHLVLAAPTYNAGLYFGMDALLRDMAGLHLQKRKVSLIENGSWAPTAGKAMRALVEGMQDMELVGEPLTIRSALKEAQLPALRQLAKDIAASVHA